MERAAILIGVEKVGNLPALPAVFDGVRAMESWALGQGIPAERVITLTDELLPVGISDIKRAVREIVAMDVVEQLVVYFAGHGVNIAFNEYWLLSAALADDDEAVNVTGSEERARFASIPHVVFVSDACRTAASGSGAGDVDGGVIFKRDDSTSSEHAVDLFFATALGRPANEIPNPADAASSHRSIFTDTLLEALHGQHAEVIGTVDGEQESFVLMEPLRPFLHRVVSKRVYAAVRRNQAPDARITSMGRWISKLSVGSPTPAELEPGTPSAVELLAHDTLQNAIGDSPQPLEVVLSSSGAYVPDRGGEGDGGGSGEGSGEGSGDGHGEEVGAERVATFDDEARATFASISQRASRPADRTHFETGCGFVVSGEGVVEAVMQEANTDVFDEGRFVRVHPARRAESTLLRFANGRGTVLPAIDGFLGVLTLVDGELVSVEYAPSATSSRWSAYSAVEEELKQLRAVIAASSALGMFRLDDDFDAERLARRMQIEKGIDPALSVYAAYAYRDIGRRERIRSMMNYQHADLDIVLFDLALLARRLEDTRLGADDRIVPFVPLLAQGWALVAAHSIEVPSKLQGLPGELVSNSVWSLYESAGVDMLKDAMLAKEVLP